MTRPRLGRLEPRNLPAGFLLTTEHTDLNFAYSPASGWSMAARDAATLTFYPAASAANPMPPAAILYAHPNSVRTRPSSPSFDFIGVGPGEPYYLLPQLQFGGLLYLGAAAYGSSGAVGYNPVVESKGRVGNTGLWIRVQLMAVDGPGSFSIWQNGTTGPIRYVSSFNDGLANPDLNGLDYTDGISADDSFWLIQGSHLHYNWGFTAPGRYDVTFRAHVLTDHDGNPNTPPTIVASDDRLFTFSVAHVGKIGFTSANYSVAESAGAAAISVARTGGADGRVAVDYQTLPVGTATPGDDYVPTQGTLIFEDLQTAATFTVPIVNDAIPEPPQTLGLRLSNFRPADKDADPVGDPPLTGAITEATLTILDDDGPVDPPPQVTSAVINMGAVQRSRVTRIDVRFNELVTIGPAAFVVSRTTDAATAGVNFTTTADNGQTVATLQFNGANTEAGSLADGLWRLTVAASGVTDSQGQAMTADWLLDFHRLFGDVDGNRSVNFTDFLAFRSSFGSGTFDPAFDADGNGSVNFSDFLQFRARFGTSI